MPEIAEVARVVHFIRQHLVGKTLKKVTAWEDTNVFGKAGCSAEQVEKALTGKKVVGAAQQGKYFWLEMGAPPQLLMHFSMAGWFHIRGVRTGYREAGRERGDDEGSEGAAWPPKYVKFVLEADDGTQAAFVDFRRFGRVRLVDCAAGRMRATSPLKENGPDPVVDKEKVSVDFLAELCARKKAPIKSVLLDQGNISGIGNWVSDEIFYDAKMHPEQYSNTLSREQIVQLHKSLHYVCGLAVQVLADSSKFPETWLFKWRWGKGKKDAATSLPNGQKIQHLTVGGRTSAIVPSVQKKTGAVAGDVKADDDDDGDEDEEQQTKTKKKKVVAKKSNAKKRKVQSDDSDQDENEEEEEEKPKPAKTARTTKASKLAVSKKKEKVEDAEVPKVTAAKKGASKVKAKSVKREEIVEDTSGRRRSKRLSGA